MTVTVYNNGYFSLDAKRSLGYLSLDGTNQNGQSFDLIKRAYQQHDTSLFR